MKLITEASNGPEAAEDDLSSREIDVLRLIATGMRMNKEIAGQLAVGGGGRDEPPDEGTRQAWR
jgi:DNA-binding NarL/FixJ family response regulator